jgi:hypothetical protein
MKLHRAEASEEPKVGCPCEWKRPMKQADGLLVGLLASVIFASAMGCSAAAAETSSDHGSESEASMVTGALGSNALTKKQASTVLKLVDDICGDTWCEGDHNFLFDQIECTRPAGKRQAPAGSDSGFCPMIATPARARATRAAAKRRTLSALRLSSRPRRTATNH